MADWHAGIIHPTIGYRKTSSSVSGGVWNLNDQLRHAKAGNWQLPFAGYPNNHGERVPITITTGTVGDTTAAFNVYHEEFNSAAAIGLTGRLYLAVKVTAATAYYNDFCIGAIQLTDNNYNGLDHGWAFNIQSDYTAWEDPTVHNINVASPGYETHSEITNAPSQSWNALDNGTGNFRWSRHHLTVSGTTGAANGIDSRYSSNDNGDIIAAATSTIAQGSADTYYAFTETSGGANVNDKYFWMRSPEVTLSQDQDKFLSIAYNAYTNADGGMTDSAIEPLLRWWWI